MLEPETSLDMEKRVKKKNERLVKTRLTELTTLYLFAKKAGRKDPLLPMVHKFSRGVFRTASERRATTLLHNSLKLHTSKAHQSVRFILGTMCIPALHSSHFTPRSSFACMAANQSRLGSSTVSSDGIFTEWEARLSE